MPGFPTEQIRSFLLKDKAVRGLCNFKEDGEMTIIASVAEKMGELKQSARSLDEILSQRAFGEQGA
jgi:hypothetical protein